ncbi:hypothetical protein [Campylobacter curvus]|uniref:Uncharacterized protein n=1 Tax=Campylobacter curvus (strain 525.92) TaxID=360105 RepID=A7H0I1_CAMC5|nr:hypothetical protein [Campylobacter curvus]EAU01418.1 hypothetical protein CCV52592_0570 [Campylobacter curvus 525.92]
MTLTIKNADKTFFEAVLAMAKLYPKVTVSKEEMNLDESLERYEDARTLDDVKAQMQETLAQYHSGDMSGFTPLGSGWHDANR